MKLKLNANVLSLHSMKTSSRRGLIAWPMSTNELEASKSSSGTKLSPRKRSMSKESRHLPERRRTRGKKLAKRSVLKKTESRPKRGDRLRKSVTSQTLPRRRKEKSRGPNVEPIESPEAKSNQMTNTAQMPALMRAKTSSKILLSKQMKTKRTPTKKKLNQIRLILKSQRKTRRGERRAIKRTQK